jgi:hypothetical protein
VIDGVTKKPIANAQITVHNHASIHCVSADDGSFDLPRGTAWRPCYFIPGDRFFTRVKVAIRANGYQSANEVYTTALSLDESQNLEYAPVLLEQPIELQKRTKP